MSINKPLTILSLDVSTTNVGATIYFQEDRSKSYWRLFKATGNVTDRIKFLAREIKDWIKDINFDLVLITKASYGEMNPNILMLEGILLGISLDRDIDFDYYGDSSWYSLIGSIKDERPTKKKVALERFINENNLGSEVESKDIKYVGGKLDKITLVMKDGSIITDDISDSWNAADLFALRQKREQLRFRQSETQNTINKLRADNKKLRERNDLIKHQINNYELELGKFKEEYLITQSKVAMNKINKRIDYIKDIAFECLKNKHTIHLNEIEVSKLMEKKNNL